MARQWTDLLMTAFAPAVWGTTYLVATQTLPADRPLLVGALRALPAGLLLVALLRRKPEGIWWLRLAVLGLLNIGLFFGLLFVAAFRLPGGVAATVGGVQPLFVALMAWLLLRERPVWATVVAGLTGALGVALIVLGPAARLDAVGVLAALASTSCMALGTVLTRRWGSPMELLPFTAWQLTFGGLALLVATLLIEGPIPALTTQNLIGAAYLDVIGTGIAYTLWFRGVQRTGTAASFLLLLSPVVALLLGIAVGGESLRPMQLLGIGLVLGSLLLTQRGRERGAPVKLARAS